MHEPLLVVDLDGDVPEPALERAAARASDCGRLLAGIAAGPLTGRVRPLARGARSDPHRRR